MPCSPDSGVPALRPGALIAVVAPAWAIHEARLRAGADCLREWGYRVIEGHSLRACHDEYAGTRAARSADLAWALTGEGIDAVFFARGGAGTMELLAHLPEPRDAPPLVVGYSDATALHAALGLRGVVSLHASIVQELGDDSVDAETRQRLRSALRGEALPAIPCELISGAGAPVTGRLVGGNLQVLTSLTGTPWALESEGAILVLEDVDEAPYRVERCLEQLRLAGRLDGLRGLVLGEFRHAGDRVSEEVARRVAERLAASPVPIYAGAPIGHGARNLCWYHGAPAILSERGLSQRVSPPQSASRSLV